jgi:hypothetical protein
MLKGDNRVLSRSPNGTAHLDKNIHMFPSRNDFTISTDSDQASVSSLMRTGESVYNSIIEIQGFDALHGPIDVDVGNGDALYAGSHVTLVEKAFAHRPHSNDAYSYVVMERFKSAKHNSGSQASMIFL